MAYCASLVPSATTGMRSSLLRNLSWFKDWRCRGTEPASSWCTSSTIINRGGLRYSSRTAMISRSVLRRVFGALFPRPPMIWAYSLPSLGLEGMCKRRTLRAATSPNWLQMFGWSSTDLSTIIVLPRSLSP
jgi:hypothetical protein